MRARSLLQIGFSAAVIGVLLAELDLDKAHHILAGAVPDLLLAAVAVMLVDRALMAWKWKLLLDAAAIGLSLGAAVRLYYVSSFLGLIMPFGGVGPDVVRFVKVRHEGVDGAHAAASILMERGLGLLASLIVAVGAIVVYLQLLPAAVPRGGIQAVAAVALGLSVLGTALVLLREPRERLLGNPAVLRLANRLRIGPIYAAFAVYRAEGRRLATFFLLSVVEQLFPVLAFFFCARALGAEIGLAACFAVIPLAALVQRIPISVAGIGLREASHVALLTALGVPFSAVLLVSMGSFLVLVASLLPGGLWAIVDAIQLRTAPVSLTPARTLMAERAPGAGAAVRTVYGPHGAREDGRPSLLASEGTPRQ